ncbi:hypothetical protein NFI95_11585 [Acetobacteraceae bacterium KSS8]|uniref:Uncharacterized protein n=1 Tax=Endosaccharibacter trunci TaxID=2812733 RepID=A0ABT1W880_9PROT|nr:hypothetical protein [Acetobacteraceae bacterium KSS8]
MLLWFAITGAAEAAAAEQCNDSHEVITNAVRGDMIGKARFNGEVVTGLSLKGLCTSGIATRSGVAWIDWTQVDNIYPSGDNDNLTLQIPWGDKVDIVTFKGDPDVGRGIFMALGLLQLDCNTHAKFC